MIPLWIPATLSAAFFQNVRSSIQKHLTGTLSGQGAAYSRFVFALPWSLLCFALVITMPDTSLPSPPAKFWGYCLIGGLLQIMSTILLLHAFSYGSFAVATTLSKLEIIMVAIVGIVLLNDTLTIHALLAIVLCTIGVCLLSIGRNQWTLTSLTDGLKSRATILGLSAGAALGAAVVFFRGASLALQTESTLLAASLTLLVTLLIQTLALGLWLLVREPGEIRKVMSAWRWAGLAGAAGMLATLCWFYAFTLQNASHVRALGQTELLFTALTTTLVFKETISRTELAGCATIVGGILLLLLKG